MKKILLETLPLSQADCFIISANQKTTFDLPLHYHEAFEINLTLNGKGLKRTIGDHSEIIGDVELTLVGSNLAHGWNHHEYKCENDRPEAFEINLHFHKDLLGDNFLKKQQLYFIRSMLEKSARGISFCQETALETLPRLISLTQKRGFESVLELLSTLYSLSVSIDFRVLSSATFAEQSKKHNSAGIETVFNYLSANYQKSLSLGEISNLVGMTEISFSRFIKKRSGKTFVECLNDIRLDHASELLIETPQTIAEIAYGCGFNNLSYFNRIFKKKKGIPPKDFRKKHSTPKTSGGEFTHEATSYAPALSPPYPASGIPPKMHPMEGRRGITSVPYE